MECIFEGSTYPELSNTIFNPILTQIKKIILYSMTYESVENRIKQNCRKLEIPAYKL
jgi:hypothetical protein